MLTPGALTAGEVQKLFLDRLNLRIGPETAAYFLRRLEDGQAVSTIPVMGGNARTGVPVRLLVDPSQVRAGLSSRSVY